MKIAEFIPNEQLKPYIEAYRIIESAGEMINRVVPNTSFAMAFRLNGKVSYLNYSDNIILPNATFSGLRKSVRLISYAPNTSVLIVLFKATGVSSFFRLPLQELFEKSVSLDNFFPNSEISIITERLSETASNNERIVLIEQFLCSKLTHNYPDKLVSEAVAKIYLNGGSIKMRELAYSLFISQDAFEKRFRKIIGASPKQFSSIVRMKNIVHQSTSSVSFLDMALENGYYDHSHFNKDFKLFTGQTPTEFFRSASFW